MLRRLLKITKLLNRDSQTQRLAKQHISAVLALCYSPAIYNFRAYYYNFTEFLDKGVR